VFVKELGRHSPPRKRVSSINKHALEWQVETFRTKQRGRLEEERRKWHALQDCNEQVKKVVVVTRSAYPAPWRTLLLSAMTRRVTQQGVKNLVAAQAQMNVTHTLQTHRYNNRYSLLLLLTAARVDQ
jgi:endo-alpha-1,4-polygalactosaminidase (GH114 family)